MKSSDKSADANFQKGEFPKQQYNQFLFRNDIIRLGTEYTNLSDQKQV